MGKHQSLSKPLIAEASRIPLSVRAILVTTVAVTAALRVVPYELADGHRIPKFIFTGRSSAFHLFKVLIMFGFSGAFSSLFLRKNPKMERLCRYYSLVSMASAIGLLLCAISVWRAWSKLQVSKIRAKKNIWGYLYFGRLLQRSNSEYVIFW